jgi:hypothetical protein
MQPGTQQGRCLHVGWKNAPRRSDKAGDTQGASPVAQFGRTKAAQQGSDLILARAITRLENVNRLGVRQVQPAFPRQKKLAPDRGHCIV